MSFKIPSNIMPRRRYVDRLLPYVGKNVIKVLTGLRRVGKSYIMFLIMRYIQEHFPQVKIVYINLESLEYDAIRDYRDLAAYIDSQIEGAAQSAIFIDEIQEVQSFEKILRSLLLREGVDLYVTGSNSKLLSSELATVLTGRYIEIQVNSLSYPEFLDFHRLDNSDASLEKYMRYGGMPYLVNLALDDQVAYEYLHTVHSSIVYRDVVERFSIRNINFLERLVAYLADAVGNIFTSKKISDYLKSQGGAVQPGTVQIYADYLAQAYIVSKARRYDIAGKRLFEIGEKYYYGDVGLRNSLVGFKPQARGQVVENLVYNHLKYLGYNVDIGMDGVREIDFVASRNGEIRYVQACLSLDREATVEREFGNLIRIADNYPKYVVSLDASFSGTYEGVIHLSLRDFLACEDI